MPRRFRGGKAAELAGIPELQAKLQDLANGTQVRTEAANVMATVGAEASKEVVTRAQAVGLPRDAQQDIFSYGKQPPGAPRNVIASLVGIRKRGRARPWAKGYREWRAGSHPKSPRAKASPGALVGESLAMMWELGTSRRPATPFFRPAIQAMRKRIVQGIADGFRAILARHTK